MKRRNKRILLGTLMALSLVGVSTATAFIVTGATQTHQGTADSAIILDWGETSVMGEIKSLSPGAPAYREITAKAPVRSTSATDEEATVTFTLAKANGATNPQFIGLKVEIATQAWTESGTQAVGTIEVTTEDQSENLFYESDAVTVDTTFYLRFTIDQDIFNEYYAPRVDQATLSATLTAHYGI